MEANNRKVKIFAKLVITHNDHQIAVAADGDYVIVNFADNDALKSVMELSKSGENLEETSEEESKEGPLKKLMKVHKSIKDLGLVIDIRVKSKNFIVFGQGATPKVSAKAIFFGLFSKLFG